MGDYGCTPERPLGKLLAVLHPQTSLYGKFTVWLLSLMESYPAAGTEPEDVQGEWVLLAAISAPFHDQAFAKKARASCILLNSSKDKHYGRKLSTGSFPLWRIGNKLFSDAAQEAAMNVHIGAVPDERDVLGRQMLRLCPTVDAIRQAKAEFHVIVHGIFLNAHYDSGMVENLNAQGYM